MSCSYQRGIPRGKSSASIRFSMRSLFGMECSRSQRCLLSVLQGKVLPGDSDPGPLCLA